MKRLGALLRYIWDGLTSAGINEDNFPKPPAGSDSGGDMWEDGHVAATQHY
jgi:hypothetical protein